MAVHVRDNSSPFIEAVPLDYYEHLKSKKPKNIAPRLVRPWSCQHFLAFGDLSISEQTIPNMSKMVGNCSRAIWKCTRNLDSCDIKKTARVDRNILV